MSLGAGVNKFIFNHPTLGRQPPLALLRPAWASPYASKQHTWAIHRLPSDFPDKTHETANFTLVGA